MSETILRVENLHKVYGNKGSITNALKGISFTVEKGEYISIMGASGSGKTTLLNCISTIDKATSGTIHIGNDDITRMKSDALSKYRREQLGFIFQDFNLLDTLTVFENIALALTITKTPAKEIRNRVNEAAKRLNITDILEKYPYQISGGQKQRTAAARAIISNPKIILADEPTGALDSQSGENVLEILRQLHQEGHTIIMVTHDKHIAASANRMIEIKDGEIISDTQTQPVKSAVKNSGVFKGRFGFSKDQLMEAFRMSVSAIVAHKMRSLLTMLGIIIGITSVVSVVALGNGSQQKILENIRGIGTNTITIFNGTGFGDRRAEQMQNLTVNDANALRQQTYVQSVTPNSASSGTLIYANKAFSTTSLKGVSEESFDVEGLKLKQGRLLSAQDVAENAQVALIDESAKKSIFPNEDPLGKVVIFNKRPLRIIGVVSDRQMGGASSSLNLYAPYTTVMNRISGSKKIGSITVKVAEDVNTTAAEKGITELLTLRHGKKDFFIMNSDTIKQTIESTTGTMKLLISSIAFISLIVGGIGVMNIMLVSVTERTKEIGVRMAIGARQSNILQQFLIEAVLICLIGGVTGILFSGAIGLLFNTFMTDFTMAFSGGSIIAAVAFSSLIGVVFGYTPAKRAAQLDPITALARE